MWRRVLSCSLVAGLLALPATAAAADAPAAPTAVRAVAGDDGIGLTWSSPATEFNVYRDGAPDPLAAGVTTRTYVDLAAPGTTHTYTVTAVDEAGEGAASTPSTATVPTVVSEPGTLTRVAYDYEGEDRAHLTYTVTSAPGVLNVLTPDYSGFSISPASGAAWTPGPMNATVTGYGCLDDPATLTVHEARVHADGTPVVVALTGVVTCDFGTAYVDLRYHATTPVVAPDTTPEFVNSPPTKPGTTSPPATVTIANKGTAGLTLGTAVAPAQWNVVDDQCSGTVVAGGASCTFGIVFAPTALGSANAIVVVPDDTPRGKRDVHVNGAAQDVPGPVANLTARAFVGRTVLTWEPPPPAYPAEIIYTVYRATSPSGPWTQIRGSGTTLTTVDYYGTPGTRVYYQVGAYNERGEGPLTAVDVLPPGRELLYTADTGTGLYHLTARGLPGGTAMRLTTSTADEEDPDVSPDGTKLAFTRASGSLLEVYRSDVYGRGVVKMTGGADGEAWTFRNPRWSPDGLRMAYACRPVSQGWYDLCIRNLTGGTRIIEAIGLNGAVWAPNGNELYVVSATSPTRIEVVARDDSYRRVIPGSANARHLALSPDGSRLAWTRYEGDDVDPGTGAAPRYSLRVSPLSGGGGVVLEDAGVSNDPSWSADGETVYYTHGLRSPEGVLHNRDVWAATATGATAPVQVTDTPTVDEDNVMVRDVVTLPASPQAMRPLADFSGDGRAELAVFRPGTGQWRIQGLPTVTWGRLGDIPVAADYSGDRRAERAVFRPSTGTWHVYGRSAVKWGRKGDVPVPADYNGDGKAEIAVFRPSTGAWYVYGKAGVVHGKRGDIPVPADYNGDRKAEIAIYRPSSATWSIRGRGTTTWNAGTPMPADYLGKGRAQITMYVNGLIRVYDVGQTIASVTPTMNEVPVYGNVAGDARIDPGVFNPTLGLWRMLGKSNVVWGIPGDIPV